MGLGEMQFAVGWDVGTRDLAWCLLAIQETTETCPPLVRVVSWGVHDIRGRGLEGTIHNLVLWFRNVWAPFIRSLLMGARVRLVSIERQFKRAPMIAVSHVLQACHHMCGVVDTPEAVTFVRSCDRFAAIEQHFGSSRKNTTPTNTGKTLAQMRRCIKQRAIKLVCETMSACQDEGVRTLEQAAAHHKDDLADAYLLALSGFLTMARRRRG